jgi:hypothetical protein
MKKEMKSNLSVLGRTFTSKWKKEINLRDYSGNAEDAYTDVIWYRVKLILTIGSTCATILLASNLIVGTESITWGFICCFGGIGMVFLSGTLWKMLWEDRDINPGKSSVKLYKEWGILRKKLLRSGILSGTRINTPSSRDSIENFFNNNLTFLAGEVQRHETEGREGSKKRARAKMSEVKGLADELGVKTDKFKKVFETNINTMKVPLS